MNKENCALKLVDEIILYYDAPSKKHQILIVVNFLHVSLAFYSNHQGVFSLDILQRQASQCTVIKY